MDLAQQIALAPSSPHSHSVSLFFSPVPHTRKSMTTTLTFLRYFSLFNSIDHTSVAKCPLQKHINFWFYPYNCVRLDSDSQSSHRCSGFHLLKEDELDPISFLEWIYRNLIVSFMMKFPTGCLSQEWFFSIGYFSKLFHLKSFCSFYLFILLSIVVIIIGVVISIKLLTLSVNNN